jgi:hypothetical protein
VQPDPRQDVLARDEILVIRLVHVPQESDPSHARYVTRLARRPEGRSARWWRLAGRRRQAVTQPAA